jgi:hypothetical protein
MNGTRLHLTVLLLATLPAVAQRTYDCGALNQHACSIYDWERYNMRWGNHKCDAGLKERDGWCVNDKQITQRKVANWLGWALHEQLYGISQHQPINRIPWLGAHNAFSNNHQGFDSAFYQNQRYSITDQLNFGIRHLELDPQNYPIIDDFEGRVCHATNAEFCRVPGYETRLLGYVFNEVRMWLKANPGEVVILKLDDKNVEAFSTRGLDEMYGLIEKYLGDYVYRIASLDHTFSRWPTLAEIRSAGKQVLIMQHGLQPKAGVRTVWPGRNYILEDNHPKSQDFVNCVSSDGVRHANRGSKEWWDIAEGRSLVNAPGLGMDTGLITEGELRRAAGCGVAIIGMDYINALDASPVGYRTTPDSRVRNSIWSFDENDRGSNGPAVLLPNGRWSSLAASNSRQFACAKKDSYGSADDDRDWRITAGSYPWNGAFANAQCILEFGSNYEFAHPRNAYQNRQLRQVRDAAGIQSSVWLSYSVDNQGLQVAATPTDTTFIMNPGGADPAVEPLTIWAYAGTGIQVDVNAPWLIVEGLSSPVQVPAAGSLDTNIRINGNVARNMTPGVYETQAIVRNTLQAGPALVTKTMTLNVTLIIKRPVTFTIAPAANPVTYGQRVQLQTQFPFSVKGTLTFVRTSASAPQDNSFVVTVDGLSQSVNVEGLPAGRHSFAAAYSGDDFHLPSESNEVTVEVANRIVSSPSSVTLGMTYGGSVPAAQTLSINRAAAGLTATRPCGWLTAAVISQTQVTLTPVVDQVAVLAPGSYSCPVTLSDSQSATGGSTVVPVTLLVRTTMSANQSTLQFLTAGDAVAREVFVTTPNNRTVDLTAVSNQPWLTAFVPLNQTPTNIVITGNPRGLLPGTYTGRVTLTSTLATNVLNIDVTMNVVRETTVDSPNFPGLRVYVDGAPTITPATFLWAPGTSHNLTADTYQLDPSGLTRYRFVSWTQGGPQTQTITVPAGGGATYGANFAQEFRLTTNVSPVASGTISANPLGDGFYTANTNVALTAVPASGQQFVSWSGGALSGSTNPASVVMNGPKSVVATFNAAAPVSISVQSNAPTSILVNNAAYSVPGTVPMVPGLTYQIVAPAEVNATATSRMTFSRWQTPGQVNTAAFGYTAPSQAATLTLQYQQQFLVSATASPSSGGTITGTGWYNSGASVTLQATANTGYSFSGFSGTGLTASGTNPLALTALTGPVAAIANFSPTGTPNLYVTTSGARTDGPGAGQRTVPVSIRNLGSGPAVNAAITEIVNVQVLAGSGAVTAATVLPVQLGTLAGGGAGQTATSLIFNWPATASRVQFTVRYSANGGAYNGATTLTLFR